VFYRCIPKGSDDSRTLPKISLTTELIDTQVLYRFIFLRFRPRFWSYHSQNYSQQCVPHTQIRLHPYEIERLVMALTTTSIVLHDCHSHTIFSIMREIQLQVNTRPYTLARRCTMAIQTPSLILYPRTQVCLTPDGVAKLLATLLRISLYRRALGQELCRRSLERFQQWFLRQRAARAQLQQKQEQQQQQQQQQQHARVSAQQLHLKRQQQQQQSQQQQRDRILGPGQPRPDTLTQLQQQRRNQDVQDARSDNERRDKSAKVHAKWEQKQFRQRVDREAQCAVTKERNQKRECQLQLAVAASTPPAVNVHELTAKAYTVMGNQEPKQQEVTSLLCVAWAQLRNRSTCIFSSVQHPTHVDPLGDPPSLVGPNQYKLRRSTRSCTCRNARLHPLRFCTIKCQRALRPVQDRVLPLTLYW
jgi:hypothetical protein